LAAPIPAFLRSANNSFRKTEINATILLVMDQHAKEERGRRKPGRPSRHWQLSVAFLARARADKVFCPRGSAQVVEKARSGHGYQRQSKPKILLALDRFRTRFARLG
jgi:hypothetical protein